MLAQIISAELATLLAATSGIVRPSALVDVKLPAAAQAAVAGAAEASAEGRINAAGASGRSTLDGSGVDPRGWWHAPTRD